MALMRTMRSRSAVLSGLLLCAGCPGPFSEPTPQAGDDLDADGDGWVDSEDCDPANPDVHPGATERCNGIDDDCSGAPSDDEADEDGDGHRPCAGDCADDDPERHPETEELCNGVDDDCDGELLQFEDPGAPTPDLDEDGWTVCDGDCDDEDSTRSPGTPEAACNGVDDDCDGALSEDETDADLDGWMPCTGDCNDDVAAAHPGGTEQADRADDDCNGVVDDCPWTGSAPKGTVSVGDSVHARFTGGDLGEFVAGAGDVNGDGYDDILLSSSGAGAFGYLFYGPFCPGEYPASSADVFVEHTGAVGSWTDWKLAGMGDLDQDGFDDYRVGDYVYFGPPEGEETTLQGIFVREGQAAYHVPGDVIINAGDVNGDGWDDMASSFPGGDGQVWIWHGPFLGGPSQVSLTTPDAVLSGESGSNAGHSLAALGDYDEDGTDDLAIGAPAWGDQDEGAAYVVAGPTIEDRDLVDEIRLHSTTSWLQAGWTVAGGEGNGVVLVGALEPGGLAYLATIHGVSSSGALDLQADPLEVAGAHLLGMSVAALGDIDGDGGADFAIGDNGGLGPAGSPEGVVHLLYSDGCGSPGATVHSGHVAAAS